MANYTKDELSLIEAWRILSHYKRLILFSSAAFFLLFLITAFILPVKFTASVLLAPVSPTSNPLTQGLSGTASLIGLNLDTESSSNKEEAIAILKSRKFLYKFITENDLKKVIFNNRWNTKYGKWIYNKYSLSNIMRSVTFLHNQTLAQKAETLALGEPTMWEAYDKFSDMIDLSEDKDTGLITLTVETSNPISSRNIANGLILTVNKKLREDYVERTEKSIDFLEQKIEKTQISEVKQALSKTLGEHVKKIALAYMNDDFVFRVLDPAITPERKSSPKRLLFASAGLFLGLIFGFFLAFTFNMRNKYFTNT